MLGLIVCHVSRIDVMREVGGYLIVVVISLIKECAEGGRSVCQSLLVSHRVVVRHGIVYVDVSVFAFVRFVRSNLAARIFRAFHAVGVAAHFVEVVA